MLFVNFKTYKESSGYRALELLEQLDQANEESKLKVIAVLQAGDIREATISSDLEIWAQHVDPVEYGAHTGAVLPESVQADGASGTFLNHSENKYESLKLLKTTVDRCRKLNLKTLVFAADLKELKEVLKLKPDYAAYEPPELVGSKTTSVAQAKPEVVAKAVELSHDARIPLIVGAGIKSQKDVEVSVSLGADGVAVASDIVKAKDPKKETLELLEGFK
jgi:triosephosphate isomerase